MKLPRRQFLHLAAGAAAVPTLSRMTWAQTYPTRPVHLVVPFPPGGALDVIARVLAQNLTVTFGQSFIVDNRPGASGMIGAQAVARAQPDGYTLLVASPAEIALDQFLTKQMTYDPSNDFVPVTMLAWTPLVFAAHPSLEASNIAELVRLAQAKQIDFSTPGIGSPQHLTGEYFNKLASGKLTHVPYRGAALALTDAIAGHVKLTIAGLTPLLPFLRSGEVKALAVTSKSRSSLFPMIPAVAETKGFEGFDFVNWFGLLARAGTPAALLDSLEQASTQALHDDQVRETLSLQAAEPIGNTSAQFREFILAETDKYGKVVKLAGIVAK